MSLPFAPRTRFTLSFCMLLVACGPAGGDDPDPATPTEASQDVQPPVSSSDGVVDTRDDCYFLPPAGNCGELADLDEDARVATVAGEWYPVTEITSGFGGAVDTLCGDALADAPRLLLSPEGEGEYTAELGGGPGRWTTDGNVLTLRGEFGERRLTICPDVLLAHSDDRPADGSLVIYRRR